MASQGVKREVCGLEVGFRVQMMIHLHVRLLLSPHLQKKVLSDVQTLLDMPRDAPEKEEYVKELRKEINSWVAAYRREDRVAGRPSFR
jgi:hypothetical protein